MPTLDSSAISYIDYDWSSARLYITFRSGGTYTFYHVPASIYLGLVNATSPGRYYHAYIRGRYGP
jgi:hypothetical protein